MAPHTFVPRDPAALHPVERLPEEWAELLASWGEPRFRALQLFRWIHRRGVTDPSAMTDLGRALRERLAALAPPLARPAEAADVRDASDGTRKLLVRLSDGRSVESVLIPQTPSAAEAALLDPADDREDGDDPLPRSGGGDDPLPRSGGTDDPLPPPRGEGGGGVGPHSRVTQCISTQVGCAMGCVFCASGQAGLTRHMTAAEIVAQVLLGRTLLREGERLTHVVLMGMGEPLHDYDATARALRLLMHPEGIGLSSRHVTVSTAGLVPEIDRLGADFQGRVNLAVSLHAVDDAQRSALMPINRRHPLGELVAALRRYPLPRRRRITIEFTLVAGRNDDPRDARRLAELLRGLSVKVNLIPMNPIDASSLGPPRADRVERFQDVLRERGLSVFLRRRRGGDIAAACGQLALQSADARRRIRLVPA